MKYISSFLISFLLLFLSQCSKSPKIAQVDDLVITPKDIYAEHFSSKYKEKPSTEVQKQILHRLIYQKLTYLAAIKKGLLKDPSYQFNVKLRQDAFSYAFLIHYLNTSQFIPLAKLRNYFQETKKQTSLVHWNNPQDLDFEYSIFSVTKHYLTDNLNVDSLYLLPEYQQLLTVIVGTDTSVSSLNEHTISIMQKYFIQQHSRKYTQKDFLSDLLKEHKFTITAPPTHIDSHIVKKEYQKNIHKFKTQPSFQIFYIKGKTPKNLNSMRNSLHSLVEFKEIAKQLNIPKDGLLGFIKQGHSLPNGIGLIPQIYSYFKPLTQGDTNFIITPAIQNPRTQEWFIFGSNLYQPKVIKPLDRVYRQLEKKLLQDQQITDLTYPMATYKNGIITQADYQSYLQTLSPQKIKTTKKSTLLRMLVLYRIAIKAVTKYNLDDFAIYQYRFSQITEQYWSNIYTTNHLLDAIGYTQDDLINIFNQNKNVFLIDNITSMEQVNLQDIILYDLIPKNVFDLEYHTKPENYRSKNESYTFENTKPKIFFRIKKDYQYLIQEKIIQHLRFSFPVSIIDSTFSPNTQKKLISLGLTAMKKAQFSQAIQYYKKAQQLSSADTLQDSISFLLARSYLYNNEHYKAMIEHRRLLYSYPASRFNCRSQFISNYIITDYFKKHTEAIKGFNVLIQKYPHCTLASEAKFMIKELSQ